MCGLLGFLSWDQLVTRSTPMRSTLMRSTLTRSTPMRSTLTRSTCHKINSEETVSIHMMMLCRKSFTLSACTYFVHVIFNIKNGVDLVTSWSCDKLISWELISWHESVVDCGVLGVMNGFTFHSTCHSSSTVVSGYQQVYLRLAAWVVKFNTLR